MLLSEKTWKLADFNLACNFAARSGKLMRNKAGTRPFMAPEVQEKGRPGVWLGHQLVWLGCDCSEFLSTWLNAGLMLRKYDHGICALVCSRTLPSQNTLKYYFKDHPVAQGSLCLQFGDIA